MKSCCENKSEELNQVKHRNVLVAVLVINTIMFLVEFSAGLLSNSTALLADSLDMLGDAIVYAFSLYVVGKSIKWKARAALLKGALMSAFGFFVLGEAVYKVISQVSPVAETMGVIGFIALMANTICLFLLMKHRDDDINMRSTWICSRNDIIANLGVLLAAVFVFYFNSKWPDIVTGLIIASIFLKSSVSIIKDSVEELKEEK